MDFLINALPVIIVLVILAIQGWQTWKNGLFLALIQLGIGIVTAFLAFFLTRLLIDPAKVDLFGLGKLLLQHIPADFLTVMPSMEAFLSALPTALLALIGFTIIYDILRLSCNKLLYKLNAKYKWSDKYLKVKHKKPLTVVVGVLLAFVCLLPDLAILSGTLTFAGNMLYCAGSVTGEPLFISTGDIVHQLRQNPVIHLLHGTGVDQIYYDLTSAQRDGEPFSVGRELDHMSNAFVGILPMYDILNREGEPPTPEQIRALPEALAHSEETLALTASLVRSYREELGSSDAVMIVSKLLDTTPERFEEYLSQLTVETAQADLTTFCEVAALLADRGLIPESGEDFDLNALSDPELLAQAQAELAKNPGLAAFFASP